MKLLMIYAKSFVFQSTTRSLETTDDGPKEQTIQDVQLALVQVETEDERDPGAKETKLVKNLKWAAKKNSTHKILLHSFAHLSESKAAPEITKQVLNNAESRLRGAGYEVFQTPFGYFHDLEINTPGFSLARIFKEL
jgi:hypothetical protein